MKLTLVIAVMASCLFLTCVTANADNYDKSQEFEDPSVKGFVGSVVWFFKMILQTLRGVNCTIKGAIMVIESSETMIADIQDCRVASSKEVEAVIDSAEEVIRIANNILHIGENVCNIPDGAEETDPDQVPPLMCTKLLLKEVIALNNQIGLTIKLVGMVPVDAGDCVTTALYTYRNEIAGFPTFVKECSNRRQEN
ncbi:uncharacterized protein LOC119643101 isoform X1 [Glossina fuscipes]|uniref:Uncharacterized protein LOC119643101 isoform X1 n=1 Tax=Glossina fuscipes TaxID=7396 RepID=A0A9C6DPS7_9MUSC|nr:uncharacterized protein LOC119643101 isoform X1 [Glossina fuscipes]KAI9589181.1 hypothetical protein GQX74_007350 [Glossina fuscipes]